jgi:hypothetical protein
MGHYIPNTQNDGNNEKAEAKAKAEAEAQKKLASLSIVHIAPQETRSVFDTALNERQHLTQPHF